MLSSRKPKSGLRPAGYILLILAVQFCFLATAGALAYTDITAFELKKRLDDISDKGYTVVDIRSPSEYSAGQVSDPAHHFSSRMKSPQC